MADVGCAGILVADTFCGPFDALPQPGQLLALDSMPSRAGGCAANVAIDLAKQGIAVDAVGCVGGDAAAQVVLGELTKWKVGCDQITAVDEPTSQTLILLEKGQDRRYLHMFGANKRFSVDHLRLEWLRRLKVFYLGGLGVLPGLDMAQLEEVFGFCRKQGILTVLDVVLPSTAQNFDGLYRLLPQVDYFLPNEDEARQITGQSDPESQARTLLKYGPGTVIITLGQHGASATNAHGRWRSPAFQVESVDMSGGGDAFAAGLIRGILAGWEMSQILRYASALGASATTAIGTTEGVFTAEQAEVFLAGHDLKVETI